MTCELTRPTRGGAGTYTLAYDAKNRLRTVTTCCGMSATTSSYKYDPFDFRIEKVEAGSTYRYSLEGEHLDVVRNGSNQVLASFSRGVEIDEVVSGYMRPTASSPFVGYVFPHDALRSVRALSGRTAKGTYLGGLLGNVVYDPFGIDTPVGTPPPSLTPRLRYTGRELDLNAGGLY